ncbi:MAG: hypothetical protein ACHQ7M_02890, partial [Chloroflexota bacterium]
MPRQFRGLQWRLTIFYLSVVTFLLAGLGIYLDHQLAAFGMAQLQDRLLARAAGPNGPSPRRVSGSLPPPLLPQSDPELGLARFASVAAGTDRAGVTTSILDGEGQVVEPAEAPPDWHSPGNLSTGLFQLALNTTGPVGPRPATSASGRYLVLDRAILFPASSRAVIQTSVPLSDIDTLLESFRLAFAAGMVGTIVLTLTVGQPVAQLALRPLRTFTAAISQVS